MEKEEAWVCMDCGGKGDKFEVLDNAGGETKEQIWIYCQPCNIETFIDLPDED